jgi:ABC-type transport system substrate-binding protein
VKSKTSVALTVLIPALLAAVLVVAACGGEATTTAQTATTSTQAVTSTTTEPETTTTTEPETTTTISAREAIRRALDRSDEFGPMPVDEDYRIDRLKIVGIWAGVSVLPPRGVEAEIGDALLRREGSQWVIVWAGTGLDPADLENLGAPAELAQWLASR